MGLFTTKTVFLFVVVVFQLLQLHTCPGLSLSLTVTGPGKALVAILP